VSSSLPLILAFAAGAFVAWLVLAGWGGSRRRAVAEPGGERPAAATSQLQLTELLARHANDIMLLTDEEQRLVDVNDRFCEKLGYGREEALRLTVRDLRDPSTLEDLLQRTREELDSGAALFETRYRRKDGLTFPVEISVRVAELDGKRYFQATVRDITERRRLELQVQLADRMASVATLSAGVAHEINNPLAYVVGNLDYALTHLGRLPGDLAEVKKALDDARGGAVRVGQIVRDLRTFSRASDADRTEVDVRRALQGAVTLAQNEIRQRAQLSLELGPVPPVLGSAHRLGQLFLNLLVNAAQAIPPGNPERNLVQATTALGPDGRVRVEITDTGAGIAPDVLPRIFDPFFTTRAIGKGTGLGLAIVHGIVTELGGEITVRSEPNGGSIFTVLLPPARRAAAPGAEPIAAAPALTPVPLPTPPPGPQAAEAGLGADVLVVDDEPMVGRAITRMLVPQHRVTAVPGAAQALAALSSGHFDAILCDLMMPDMTGMALYDKLQAEAPALAARMVFLTGGAFTREAAEFLDRVPNARLEKPFTPAQLRMAVARLQAASRG
jgi:PAS domain S-box-containing protein